MILVGCHKNYPLHQYKVLIKAIFCFTSLLSLETAYIEYYPKKNNERNISAITISFYFLSFPFSFVFYWPVFFSSLLSDRHCPYSDTRKKKIKNRAAIVVRIDPTVKYKATSMKGKCLHRHQMESMF